MPRLGWHRGRVSGLDLGGALAALCAVACGGGDGPTAASRPAVRVVAGANVSDTIQASLAAPLVVAVTDATGKPAADALVQFSAVPVPLSPPEGCAPGACAAEGAVSTAEGKVNDYSTGTLQTTLAPSPDGSRVAYVAAGCCQDAQPLGVVAVVTGAVSVVTAPGARGGGAGPRWSPTHDVLACPGWTGPGLFTPAETVVQRFPTPYNGFVDVTLDWSGDGQWLVSPTLDRLESIDVDAGTRIPLAFTGGYYQPSWKP